ncbi:MAG: glycerol-3-phosphate 1-O-acyltransferase PlsY [Candidatus Margulisiibacteriota bacterium]
MIKISLLLLCAYVLGSIPFGVIVARLKGVDIQKVGSGNTGATNIYRNLGVVPGAIVFIADMIKGYAACWLVGFFLPGSYWPITLAGLLVIFGHNVSIFLKGKGGKGASTGVGVLLFISPLITAIIFVVVIIIIKTTRYVSVATLTAATIMPIIFIITAQPAAYLCLVLLSMVLIWYKHIPNIKRLVDGTENKIL